MKKDDCIGWSPFWCEGLDCDECASYSPDNKTCAEMQTEIDFEQ